MLAKCMILKTTYSGTRAEASWEKWRQTERVAGTQKHVIVRGASRENCQADRTVCAKQGAPRNQ